MRVYVLREYGNRCFHGVFATITGAMALSEKVGAKTWIGPDQWVPGGIRFWIDALLNWLDWAEKQVKQGTKTKPAGQVKTWP